MQTSYAGKETMASFLIDGNIFQSGSVEPGLYIVSTPIGNLSDISIRALKTLAGADVIACEDTRTTGKLLKHFGIKTPMKPYHEHNGTIAGPKLLQLLSEGKSVALVSDAGTPLISDPGYKLVASARSNNTRIIPIPGASAPMSALVASGLKTDSFMFAGFLPSKETARRNKMRELVDVNYTLIFFESPNRLAASLQDMIAIFGKTRHAAIGRELTKLHEEITSGNLTELADDYSDRKIRGEVVVIVEAANVEGQLNTDELLIELMATMSVSRAAAEAADLSGKTKRDMYQRALALRGE